MSGASPIFDVSTLAVACEGLGFSEGPVALPDGSVLLVDIKKQCLTRVMPDGTQVVVAKLPGGPNGAAFGPDGRLYIANNGGFAWQEFPLPNSQVISLGEHQAKDYAGGSIQVLDLATGQLDTLYTECGIGTDLSGLGPRTPKEVPSPSRLRGPDDLVFDSAGGFWFADFGKSRARDKDTTGIYYARTDGTYIREKIFPLDGPNGIALSPAGDRLYVSLTFRRQLLYWELDGPGSIRPNPATIDGAYVLHAAMPGDLDSIKVDEHGNVHAITILPSKTPLCNGGVTVVSPSGEIVERFELAVPGRFMPMPSNLCWGGPDGKTAWITGGGSDALLKVRTSIAGLRPAWPAVLPEKAASPETRAGDANMSSPPDPPAMKFTFGRVLAIILLQFVAQATTGLTRRGQHPKQHGVVRATFEVLDDIPPQYKVGLFAKPGRYDALIRFSNGPQKEDRQQGAQGMAIKLLGVPGQKILKAEANATTHDFILIDGPVFFVRTTAPYLRLFKEMVRKLGGKPTEWEAYIKSTHPEDMPAIETYQTRNAESPLTRPFWSQVPYAFGLDDTTIVRYRAVPGPNNMTAPIPPQYRDENFLRRVLLDQLTTAARPATFDFRVQLRTDATPDIIDTPTLEWDTPEQRVATITIPAQIFDRPEQERFGETLSYTPWHALPEHRPVGDINRIRRWVYAATSRMRHFMRLAPRREPTSPIAPLDPGRPLRRWAEVASAALVAGAVVTGANMLWSKLHVPLPTFAAVKQSEWMTQNWQPGDREWYHHASQGGQFPPMINVPFEWFMALERPNLSLGDAGALSDQTYLDRFGFIPSSTEAGAYDWSSCKEPARQPGATGYDSDKQLMTWRHRLPVGLTCSDRDALPMLLPDGRPWRNPATGETMSALGLTCAACHTGRLTYQGSELLIDGGSAMTDIVKLNQTIAAALFLTNYDPLRFRRFTLRVLGPNASDDSRAALAAQLDAVVGRVVALGRLDEKVKKQGVEEGFGRLDALTRIGNQVFSIDLDRPENYAGSAAPVHYPRIWDTHWFPWAQYSASIGQPMVRNAGEALGTGASIALTGSSSGSLTAPLYTSTLRIGALAAMETMLAGQKQPFADKKFTGLEPPKWPEEILGKIDPDRVKAGAKLYAEICEHCHLPPKHSAAFWDPKYWTEPNKAGQRYLNLVEIPVKEVGTDQVYLETVAGRRVKVPKELGLDDDRFAYALRDVVGKAMTLWYESRGTSKADRDKMDGYRKNDVQVEAIYKVRPLDGVWATPPYLHNASVPSIWLLLSPANERPKTFWLGHREYDPKELGYKYKDKLPGGFKFDTTQKGNSNAGHSFENTPNNEKTDGVVGRKLEPEERLALIEFLKAMSDPEKMPKP